MLECICVRLWSSCFFVRVHVQQLSAKKVAMSGTTRGQEPKTPDLLIRMLRLRPRPTSRKKLRQVDLAALVGVDTRTVQQWENGERLPSPESLQRLITAFVDEKIFLPGEEKAEALQLWEAVSQAYEDRPGIYRIYPPFDEQWFDILFKKRVQDLSAPPSSSSDAKSHETPGMVGAGLVPPRESPLISPRESPLIPPRHELVPAQHKTPTNVPTRLSSFIGRQSEMVEIQQLLTTTSLVTLTGSGGCGKTRLALQIATRQLDIYTDGVWFVELAALTEPSLVPYAVLTALTLSEQPDQTPLETLISFLSTKNALLVLDNCEHLIDACATFTETLLSSCPTLHILATSREALNIPGEAIWRVPSLSLPSLPPTTSTSHVATRESGHVSTHQSLSTLVSQSEAVQLFVERTRTILPHFTLTDQNAPAIVHICQRLDGLPLALELAAARTNVLSVEQIAERLEDRFLLLTAGRRTAIPRHQTLRAAIDWSYALLTEQEQTLFQRLSIFMGGCTLDAVESICADPAEENENGEERIKREEILDLLAGLVNKSLVMMEEQAETRYHLLETMIRYGWEQLEERKAQLSTAGRIIRPGMVGAELNPTPTIQQRHAHYYLAFVEQAEAKFRSSKREEVLELVQAEYENLRAAWQWSQLHNDDEQIAGRIAGALYWFWLHRGSCSEGRNWLEKTLPKLRAKEPGETLAKVLHGTGVLAWTQGDSATALVLAEEGLSVARQIGHTALLASSLRLLAHILLGRGELTTAQQFAQESVEQARASGDAWQQASSLNTLGKVLSAQRAYAEAEQLYTESITLFRTVGDNWELTEPLRNLGHAAFLQGAYERAANNYQQSIALCQELRGAWFLSRGLEGLATVLSAQSDYIRATTLLGAAETLRASVGASIMPAMRTDYEQTLATLQHQLDQPEYRKAWEQGQAMSAEQVIAYALADRQNNA